MCQYLHDNNNNLYIDCKYLENIMSSVILQFFFYIAFQFGCIVLQHKKTEPKNVLFLMREFLLLLILTLMHQ